MKTLTLTAIALSLTSTLALARDNDARDTYKWLQSVTHSQSEAQNSNTQSSANETVTRASSGNHH
jgi:hypothetical protein